MNRLAVIPARGGSVRIPRKNIKPFAGKPMLQWPVEAAKASGLFGQVIVSTDDDEIAALARGLGCWVHWREPDDGTTGTQEIAAQALDLFGPAQEACVIYPCTPMLTAADLADHYRQWHNSQKPFSVACLRWKDGEPYDAGAMYWGLASAFRSRLPLQGNAAPIDCDPGRFIDINTPADWRKAKAMFTALRRANP